MRNDVSSRKTSQVGTAGTDNAGGSFASALGCENAIDTLARTIYGEARGEPNAGREAVANVVLNRIRFARSRPGGTYWWGSTVISVCRKAWQFSCWNENDPNREKLALVQPGNPAFAACLNIARRAVDGELRDNTDGATHYHVVGLPFPKDWGDPVEPHLRIGRHDFYKGIP